MSNTGFGQEISPAFTSSDPSTSDDVWLYDVGTLDKPVLVGPKDGTDFCDEDVPGGLLAVAASSGITLRWAAVSGADFYVVQWSNNSSFEGATVRGFKTTSITKVLNFGDDIRLCENVYWRVGAFALTGASSPKSETWSFKYDCKDLDKDRVKIGCSAFNVDLKIAGSDFLLEDEERLYHLTSDWDKHNKNGGIVTLQSVEWTLRQDASAVSILCKDEEDHFLILKTSDNISEAEVVHLTAEVTFKFHEYASSSGGETASDGGLTGESTSFTCKAVKDITIENVSKARELKHGKIYQALGNNIYWVQLVERVFAGADPTSVPASTSGISFKDQFCGSSSSGAVGCISPEYEMDWLESVDEVPELVLVGDIVCRVLPEGETDLPVGTDVIIGRIEGPKYSQVTVTAGDNVTGDATGCNAEEKQIYWWIVEADTGCLARPCTEPVVDVECSVDCDGNPIIEVTTQKILHVPGTVVCPPEPPPPLNCTSSAGNAGGFDAGFDAGFN